MIKSYITQIEILSDNTEHATKLANISTYDGDSYSIKIEDVIMSAEDLHEIANVLERLEDTAGEFKR